MTLTAATDVLVPHPAPDSVTGQLARVFATAPTRLCPHLAADLSGPVFVSMADPDTALCWECLLEREETAALRCDRCQTSSAGTAGFTYAMRGRQVIAAGLYCPACTAADLDQPGAVVLDVAS